MRLQKLCYYGQAWSLVWDDKALFSARIEAWANGPVCPSLYDAHRGQLDVQVGDICGDSSALGPAEIETLDAVLKYYGGRSSQWLTALVHAEQPWRDARSGLRPGDRGCAVIAHSAMAEYYGSL